jgi:EmrB/QacA subfamily drug resistance transporter
VSQAVVDYSRKWYVMLAVSMSIFLGTIDGSIVNIAQPTLVRVFATSFALVQWVTLAYLLVLATLLLSIGRLADIGGKKPLFTAGLVIFTVGSGFCGIAQTVGWLIGFRVVQAIGAAMITALGVAIVTEAFPSEERGRAIGITGSIVSLGIILGPTLGGVLIDALSWHWIFFVNLPVGLLGLFLTWRYVPSYQPAGGQRFDYAGAITLGVSLLALLLALTLGQDLGFGAPVVLGLFALWIATTVAFVMIEWRSHEPMVDLTLFRNPLFSVNVVTGFITFVAISGTILLMPFYLENVRGYSTREVGLLLAVVPIGLGVLAPLAGAASDRFGPRTITLAGLGALLIGYVAVSTLGQGTGALGYLLRFAPVGIGMGIFQSPNNSAIMGSVPRERLGVASGLLSLTRTLGQTIGVATLGALWAGRVQTYAADAVLDNATAAPAPAQVAALHDTVRAIVVMIAVALVLSVWGLLHERRGRRMPVMEPQPEARP